MSRADKIAEVLASGGMSLIMRPGNEPTWESRIRSALNAALREGVSEKALASTLRYFLRAIEPTEPGAK